MFFPYTYDYGIPFDNVIYGGTIWIFAELLGGLAAAVTGLLCLWFAFGKRQSWFVRAIPVVAIIWATLLVPAYELGIVTMLQCSVVLTVAWIRGKREIGQFRLSNLLLVIVVAAACLGYLVRVPQEIWYQWPALVWFGHGFGLVTMLAAYIGSQSTAKRRWWIVGLVSPAFLVMLVWLRVSIPARTDQASQKRTAANFIAIALASVTVALPVTVALAMLIQKAPLPTSNPPLENRLPNLITLGDGIPQARYRPYPSTPVALKSAAKKSTADLASARELLKHDGWVDVNYDLRNPTFQQRAPARDALVQICYAFLAEAELSESENRIPEALGSYRDLFRLAKTSCRGGLPFDIRLATEIEGDAMGRVYRLRADMTKQQCAEWIVLMSEQESTLESVDVVMHRRHAWVDRVARWQDRLSLYLIRWLWREYHGRKQLEDSMRDRQLRISLLKLVLALRQHHLDFAEYPEEISSLAPAYVPALPDDPVSTSDLVYRRIGSDYLLYSIGFDGKDDGGKMATESYWFEPGDISPDAIPLWCTFK